MSIIKHFSSFVLPTIIVIFSLILHLSKKVGAKAFFNGALDGAKSSLEILPNLCLLIVGVNMFTASGAVEIMKHLLDPLFNHLKIPTEILPLIITRPLSSGASIATYEDIISRCGADSFEALCASVIMASSDTAAYVIGVYFSVTKVKKTRYAIPCAIVVTLFCIFVSCALCRVFFE